MKWNDFWRQVLIVAFLLASVRQTGVWNAGHVTNVLLQSVYIGKFFWWETGYFTTLDITLDRAGYYICWGCLVWVPSFYTYSSFFLVAHPSQFTAATALLTAALGNHFTTINLSFLEFKKKKKLFFFKFVITSFIINLRIRKKIVNFIINLSV